MQKEKLKQNEKIVGVALQGDPHHRGITLIALIITIIVMLILVGVSVTVALNGGLFNTAKDAKANYIRERDREIGLSDGKIEIDGYSSIDEYLNGSNTDEPTDTPAGYTAYSIGDVVTIGTETFYVIEASDSSNPNLKLLAKDNIDTTNLVQSANVNAVVFSTETYWEANTDIEEPEPTLDEETGKLTLPASHIAAKAAYDYGTKVGGTGRLMTYSEAEVLKTAYTDIFSGTNGKSSREYLFYWLGSTGYEGYLWYVIGSNDTFYSDDYGDDSGCGVRPVVEIAKSAL